MDAVLPGPGGKRGRQLIIRPRELAVLTGNPPLLYSPMEMEVPLGQKIHARVHALELGIYHNIYIP
jgi:hypothetical protein